MSSPDPAGERQVVRALGAIGSATLLSRVLGFARDVVVALAFGAGPVTDAFFVAFRIPNLFRRLLAEGALSTAVVPVFSEYAAARPREFRPMLRVVLTASLGVLGVATGLGILAAPAILAVVAPGFAADPAQAALAVFLTRLMFPYLLLVGLAALAMGALHAHGRFFAAALGPAVLNVGMIAGVLLLAERLDPPILALAVGVLVGGAGQVAVQLPSLRRLGLLVRPAVTLAHPAVARIGRLLLPAVVGLGAVQVTVLVNTILASWLPAGSISFLYYADRVMEFPLGVFGIALASAVLPTMSRQAAAGGGSGMAATLSFALRLAFFVAVPATVGLMLLREPIVRILFERGAFAPAATGATAAALAWYAAGLAGLAGARVTAQAFYAAGRPGTAVRLGLLAVGVHAVAAVVLMGPLAHAGLAAATSLAAWVNLAALALAARRRFGPLGGRALAASAGRTTLASGPLAAWCVGALALEPTGAGLPVQALWLGAAVAGGTLVFWLASALLGAPERRAFLDALPRSGGG